MKDEIVMPDVTGLLAQLRARLEFVEGRLQEFQRLPENDESQWRGRLLQWTKELGTARHVPFGLSSAETLMELSNLQTSA